MFLSLPPETWLACTTTPSFWVSGMELRASCMLGPLPTQPHPQYAPSLSLPALGRLKELGGHELEAVLNYMVNFLPGLSNFTAAGVKCSGRDRN